ncbi:ABC transporter permease subunit [Cryptosporangium arvum]|uniref:ABC transporter permease subunit n=1 Tax=Cryptosporangium arvum TaxID=80871 RepID=UPI0004AF132C|nr:ABC transporter permease subunit [Cryptosporangium arvum]
MNVLTAEWTKARTIRSTVGTLLVTAALTVGTALLVALTGSLHPGEPVLAAALGNSVLGLVGAGAFGVLMVSTEYSGGTIRATVAAVPRRSAVLLAKAAVTGAAVFVVALVASAVAFGGSALLLDRADHPLGNPLSGLLGAALCHVTAALLGLAFGSVLRSAAGGICAVAGLLLVPTLFGSLLGPAEPWVTGGTPVAALQKFAGATEAPGSVAAWPTVALVAGYTGAVLAGSVALFRRRDV